MYDFKHKNERFEPNKRQIRNFSAQKPIHARIRFEQPQPLYLSWSKTFLRQKCAIFSQATQELYTFCILRLWKSDFVRGKLKIEQNPLLKRLLGAFLGAFRAILCPQGVENSLSRWKSHAFVSRETFCKAQGLSTICCMRWSGHMPRFCHFIFRIQIDDCFT